MYFKDIFTYEALLNSQLLRVRTRDRFRYSPIPKQCNYEFYEYLSENKLFDKALSRISISKVLRGIKRVVWCFALGRRFKSSKALKHFASSGAFDLYRNSLIPNYPFQSSIVFDLLKAHLKRAPSLRGAALVRLASLKYQAEPWPPFVINKTEALARLDEVRDDNKWNVEQPERFILTPSSFLIYLFIAWNNFR